MNAVFQKPEDIADAIVRDVGKTVVLALPLGLGKACHIANALYARAVADRSIDLTIITALTLEAPKASNELERRFLGPLVQRLFAGYPEFDYARALRAGALPPNIRIHEFFLMAGRWLSVPNAQQNYISANYTHVAGDLLARGVNVIGQLVAKKMLNGTARYSLSCNTDLTLDLLKARAEGKTHFKLAGQVNSELPFMPGEGDLDASALSYILDSPVTDFPLFAPPKSPITTTDYARGLHIARLVPDGGTLQIGIGEEGDAVAHGLILRHHHNAAFREGLKRLAPSDVDSPLHDDKTFSAGLYGLSEMFVDAFLALRDVGILKRKVDGVLLHGGFFLGPRSFYRALREMDEGDLRQFQMMGISFTNALYGDEMVKRRGRAKARFINNAMMATLLGEVISDGFDDGRVVSGVGGQYNFVSQAFALEGARSIITLKSMRYTGGKWVSNIRWNYGHTTIPRHLKDIIVTEYGVADLRGKADRDVIAAMLAITDSRFQEGLLREAKDAGKIEKGFLIPAWARENTPERIASALAPLRDQGLLPLFPFGTDFTDTEQRLLPALEILKRASSSPLALMQLVLQSFPWLAASGDQAACLARLGLAAPKTLSEHAFRLLVGAALRRASRVIY